MDALSQLAYRPGQANHFGTGALGAGPLGALRGEGLARQTDDFQRANDSARILAVHFLKGDGIAPLQFFQQLRQRCRLQFGADVRVARRRWPQTFQIGLEVESGAAAKNGPPPARLNVLRRHTRQSDKLGRVETFLERDDVDEVVPDALAFSGGGFGRAYA